MALWNGMGQVASIAQLAGVDAYGLIMMIVEAARTVKRNRETCQLLARRVKMIGDLLEQLQSTQLMQHPETRNPVEQLEETLRRTYMLLTSCQDNSYLHSCFMGGKQADQLREVQNEITFYLQLFPLVGFVDTTRTWERLLNRPRPLCTERNLRSKDLISIFVVSSPRRLQMSYMQHIIRYMKREPGPVYSSGAGDLNFTYKLRIEALKAIEIEYQGVTGPPAKSDEEQTASQVMNIEEILNLIGVGGGEELLCFNFSQILDATDNLSWRNLVGNGGFGYIYKGKLPNGLEIAVKRHRTSSLQGAGEFRAEIEAIANLRHKNIITLLGFCVQGEEKILVYEYMENKSWATIIADETKRKLLNWSKRFQIIRGIADGLAYLHDHSQMCIVHRDIKASNILLDHEMNAKISDFGLAITLAPNVTAEVAVYGTWGYADPEYVATGKISEKTDVYGFGIVLLEIICGKMCLSYIVKAEGTSQGLPLPEYARKYQNRLHKLIDPLLGGKKRERAQIMECVKVALLCVRNYTEYRPTMSEVVTMLGGIESAGVPARCH